MFCRYCGKELPENSNYCPNCGSKQQEGNEHITFKISNTITPQLIKALNRHKKVIFMYVSWVLLHLTLFIASRKGHNYENYNEYGNWYDGCYDRFYPFNMSFSRVIQGDRDLHIDFLGESIDYYDFTEFFVYTILIPFIIFLIIRIKPYVIPLIKRVHSKWKEWRNKPLAEMDIEKNPEIKTPELSSPKEQTNSKDASVQTTQYDTVLESMKKPTINNDLEQIEEIPDTSAEVVTMPLFRRFIGSTLDKLFIILLFGISAICINPFGASGALGKYTGMLKISPNNYEVIDQIEIQRYGQYESSISKYYQDMERILNNSPHIGSTMELDIIITTLFILFNLFYYIIFESTISASPGKRLLGGVLTKVSNKEIDLSKIMVRALYGFILMAVLVLVLHIVMRFNYYIVIIIFFLIMDLPIFFTKRSLLDICTRTKYIKRERHTKNERH